MSWLAWLWLGSLLPLAILLPLLVASYIWEVLGRWLR